MWLAEQQGIDENALQTPGRERVVERAMGVPGLLLDQPEDVRSRPTTWRVIPDTASPAIGSSANCRRRDEGLLPAGQ